MSNTLALMHQFTNYLLMTTTKKIKPLTQGSNKKTKLSRKFRKKISYLTCMEANSGTNLSLSSSEPNSSIIQATILSGKKYVMMSCELLVILGKKYPNILWKNFNNLTCGCWDRLLCWHIQWKEPQILQMLLIWTIHCLHDLPLHK